MGRYYDSDGRVVEVDDAYAQGRGLAPVTDEDQRQRDIDAGMTARGDERGFLGTLNAAATSALSGATLGLSDVALANLGTVGDTERLAAERKANPGISTAANIVGGLATSFAAPGSLLARTPGGVVAQAANRGVAAGRATGGVGGAVRVAAASGAEAAAQSAGAYLSDVALGDRELTAEGMAGALGRGFAFGSAAGGAIYGVERGAIAAQRMFSRVGAGKSAQLVETQWTNKSTEVLDAHDELANVARKRLEEAGVLEAEGKALQAKAKGDMMRAKADEAMNRGRLGGMPADAADIAIDGATTTVRARELADRGFSQLPGVGDDAVKMEKARKAIAEGQREPIKVTVRRDGSLDVADGRHRLEAAIEADAPIAVSWSKGGDAPFAGNAPPAATLESQLAEMQSRVSSGATLQDLNAARTPPAKVAEIQEALAEYATARERVNAWTERIRNPRVQHHGINVEGAGNAASGFGRVRGTLASDVPVEQSGGQIRLIGAKENTLDSLTPNSRLLGADVVPDRAMGQALDEEYHELIDMARTSATKEERAFALQKAAEIDAQVMSMARGQRPEVDAVIDRIEALRSQHGRSAATSAEKRLERLQDRYEKAGETHMLPKPERQAPISRAPTRKPDVPAAVRPTFVDDAAEAAEVLSEYEKAAAKLTDAVDDVAPRAAKQARDDLRKAESEAERRATDRTVRAIDDQANGVKRPKSAHQQKMAALKEQKAEADLAVARARQQKAEAEATLAQPQPPKQPNPTDVVSLPGAPAAANGNRLDSLADVGAVLEAADTIGIPGLPRPSDLPLIGPLLGLYLKYRAVKAIAGRMTGRVPATGDARAAALAAKTKDRALVAVDRLLGFVEKATPTARNLSVRVGGRLADALSKPLHDDGESTPKDAPLPQLAAARARELAAAVSNPNAITARVRGELTDISDPDLIAAAEAFELRKIEYLHKHAPKEPPVSPLAKRQWLPTTGESMKFARRVEVADDPVAALEAVENRSITHEQADALRNLYPRLFASCQERLIERSAEITQTVPRDQRFRLSLLFDVPLDRLLEPDSLALLQKSGSMTASQTQQQAPQQGQPPMPSTAAPVDMTALYQSPSDRRAMR